MRVLRGTFDQSDFIRFPKYFGRQCVANAVAANCKAYVVNPSLWTSQIVDECLMAGHNLFDLSYTMLPKTFTHLYLLPDELCSTISFPEYEITFQVQMDETYGGTSTNNIATIAVGPTNYCLHDAILCLFHHFNFAVLTCQVESIAIMKMEHEYYVFDSHKRGKNGLCDGTDGTAVLVCFTEINELVLHLQTLFNCSRCSSAPTVVCTYCQFSISPLLITSVTNVSNNAESNHTKTSSNVNKTVSKLELARNAKKNKSTKKSLQKMKKVPSNEITKVKKEISTSSTTDLINKIYDLRIRPNQVKYERTEEQKVKNVQQISDRYKTNDKVRNTKRIQVRDKYHNDESFKELHSKKMHEKYNTNDSFHISHKKEMKEKYHYDNDYHDKLLNNAKSSYQTSLGYKRKSNYENSYRASKKTKICLNERFYEQKKEMPTVICTCCAQLFFKKSTVNEITLKIHESLSIPDVCRYRNHLQKSESGNVCSACASHLKKGKIPHFAAINGLLFDPLPQELTGLTTLEERLVSARIPFMQIRELGYQKQLGLKGNCVNVPININKTVTCLPRMDSEDDTLLVQLMRRMSDKTPYAFENVRPERVFDAAKFLINTELYKQHKIALNENWLQQFHEHAATNLVSSSNEDDPTEEYDQTDDLTDQQETLLTTGFVADSGIKIAPGEGNMPLSLTLDEDMDVLAFPTVYGGKQRQFKVKYTPVEIAKAEARHHDRQVATNIPKLMMNFCKARSHKLKSRININLRKQVKTNFKF